MKQQSTCKLLPEIGTFAKISLGCTGVAWKIRIEDQRSGTKFKIMD